MSADLGDVARDAIDDPGTAVTFRGGAVDASMAWRGDDRRAHVRGRSVHRSGFASGAVKVDFPVVPSLGQRAAPLVFDVPDGATVDVTAGYRSGAEVVFADDFESPRPLSAGWSLAEGRLEARPTGHAVHAVGLRARGDGSLSVRCRRERGAVLAVAVRSPEAGDGLWWEGDASGSRLVTVSNGEREVVSRDDRPVPQGRWFDLAIDSVGGEVSATLNGHGRLAAEVGWTTGRILLAARWESSEGDGVAAAFDELAFRDGSARTDALWRTGQQGTSLEDWQTRSAAGEGRWDPGAAGVAHRGGQGDVAELLVPTSEAWDNYLVTATFESIDSGVGGRFGIVFRSTGPEDWYRLGFDPAARTLELSRSVGGQRFDLRKVPVEVVPGDGLTLGVQAKGFALEVLVGDQVVMREFDGAHERGQVGLYSSAAPGFVATDLSVRPPAAWVGSTAIVRVPTSLSIHGAEPSQAGAQYWLGLTTRQLPVVRPLDRDGLPLWLNVRADVPWFDLGRYVHRYNQGFRGYLDDAGGFRARVEWPDEAVAVHGDVLGVALWVVDAAGSARRWR